MAGRRGFGSIRRLPSKRYQVRYAAPDGVQHTAPMTFDARADAESWLADRRREIADGTWQVAANEREQATKMVTFGNYAETWLAGRTLQPRTREHYRKLLDNQILPTFTKMPVRVIDPPVVRRWYNALPDDRPTLRAHAYSLFRAVLVDAVYDGMLAVNPCHIRGAGNAKKVHKTRPATLAELETIVAAMPVRYRPMVLLAAWCALRFGELTELRRKDVDLKHGVIRVRRGVVRVGGDFVIGTPKTRSSIRDVSIPPHLIPTLRAHLETLAWDKEALLFAAADGDSMAPSTLYKVFYPARIKAGRPDLRFHDLRHTGAVLAASTGATLAELMGRLGHSTPGAALRYQHAAEGRDAIIAQKLSALVETR